MKIIKAAYKSWGGIHPRYHKNLAADRALRELPMPELLAVSMSQHLGAPAKPCVKKGDQVLNGQVIGTPAGFISAAVHAPAAGSVKDVRPERTLSGAMVDCVIIEPDGTEKRAEELIPIVNWAGASAKNLISRVGAAGIAGMGGAGFPTHVKLSPPPDKKIDTLIINGAECEPYLTADYRLMLERAERVWQGAAIIRHILGANTVRVAIEDNKPEAIRAMEMAMRNADGDVAIVELPTEYPQGAEKQQIFAITGREVPSGGLPMDVGAVVENVGTAAAVFDAVYKGLPLTRRITTVTGLPLSQPGNIIAPLGTPYRILIEACGGCSAIEKLLSGGPMMGLAQAEDNITTTKTTSGLLALGANEVSLYESMPCIGCGRCVDACPMNLVPAELSQFLEAEDYENAEELRVMDCIECGCCAFSCPAHRPLVQHMRQGKARIMLNRKKTKQG